jgi:ribose transport system permease protein
MHGPPMKVPRARSNSVVAVRRYGIVVALFVLLAVLWVASPTFFRATNFANILAQWAPIGIMSVGTTYVILAGGFDLSVAAGFAFCAVVAAALAQAGVPASLSFLAAIAAGVLIGLVNAALVVGLRINPFAATLASGFVLTSLPYLIVKSPFIEVDQPGFDVLGTGVWHGLPYTGLILIGFLVVFGVILSKTQYGHLLYAVGGNAEISRLFGIPTRLVVGSTYVFSGFCVGTAASLATSQLSYSASDQDPVLVFDVIVAVGRRRHVVGGRRRIDVADGCRTGHSRRCTKRPQPARYQHLLPIYHQRLPHHHSGQPRCLDTVAVGRPAAASCDFNPAHGSGSSAKHLRPIIGEGTA